MSILDVLRKKKPETAADLKSAIDGVTAEMPAARARWEKAESDYDDLVLDGTDAQRSEADRILQIAERAFRDLDVALTKLRERHDEALKRETRAGMVVLSEQAAAAVERQAEILRIVGPSIEKLMGLAKEFESLDDQLRTKNAQLEAGGFADLKVRNVWHRAVKNGWQRRDGFAPAVAVAFPDGFTKQAVHHNEIVKAAEALKG